MAASASFRKLAWQTRHELLSATVFDIAGEAGFAAESSRSGSSSSSSSGGGLEGDCCAGGAALRPDLSLESSPTG